MGKDSRRHSATSTFSEKPSTQAQLLTFARNRRDFSGIDPRAIVSEPVITVAPGRLRVKFGPPILRSEDFLSLEIGLVNISVLGTKASKATLSPLPGKAAYIVLRFPPQSIAEQAFYETPDQGVTDKDAHHDAPSTPPQNPGDEQLKPPPIKSRISGLSRIVFRYDQKALNKAGIDQVEYTLAGILAACQHLPLSIARNAQRQPERRLVFGGKSRTLGAQHRAYGKYGANQRAAVLASTLRNFQLIATGGADAANLILRRAELSAEALNAHLPSSERTISGKPVAAAKLSATPPITGSVMAAVSAFQSSRLQVAFAPLTSFLIAPPIPRNPGETETALEMPWRLLLSPNESGRFVHDTGPASCQASGYTPLWHTRLGTCQNNSSVVLEGPGSGTEVRAIWARVGADSDPNYFNGAWSNRVGAQNTKQPNAGNVPFQSTLDDRDRFNIVHLSSNFSLVGGRQEPIECKRLMLSTLGGWLDLRGAWEVPSGLSVEEWLHQSTQARDHYVKVVYKGYLLPFGHRVSLVKVTERKFQHQADGNPAYLKQRMFMVIREPVRDYPVMHRPGVGIPPYPPGAQAFSRFFHREFPFARVHCLTRVTPNLAQPAKSQVGSNGQQMFWPSLPAVGQPNGVTPFLFSYVATDLDGHEASFELPAIFIDNQLANPGSDPSRENAEKYFFASQKAYYQAPTARRTAAFNRQRVALACSNKPGDTAVEVESITFGAEVEQLRKDSATCDGPLMYPIMQSAAVRIPSVSYLAGGNGINVVTWNQRYVGRAQGFDAGEVFVDVEPGGAGLDFTAHGNRSGGFVQPNLAPSGISRLSGPISGDVDTFAGGHFDGTDFFASLSPLLFGCIPLGEVIGAFDLSPDKLPRLPKFMTEAATVAQTVFSTLGQSHELAESLQELARTAVAGALRQVVASAMHQIAAQIAVLDKETAAIAPAIAEVENAASTLATAIDAASGVAIDSPVDLANALSPLLSRLASLHTLTGQRLVDVPTTSALSDTVKTIVMQQLSPLVARIAQVEALAADIMKLPDMIAAAGELATRISALLVPPDQLKALLDNPGNLKGSLDDINGALDTFRPLLQDIGILDGSFKKATFTALDALKQITSETDKLIALLTTLLGDEMTVRLAWQPEVNAWPSSGQLLADLGTLFKPHDKNAFGIAVEAKVKKSSGEAKIKVQCALRNFDLILLGEKHSFIGLAFDRIEFSTDSASKMNVDVVLDAIHFLGPLKFVETLKDLIPLDGFSDPPSLTISQEGIDAGFSMALPNLSIGVLNISNLSLGAGFTLPFIGQPLSVRFNFCERAQPFCLTVAMFGGGGFFGLTVDPHGVQLLEASFEFGAAIAIDFGVASGGVHVMAGIYFRIENDACTLTGYFRLGGEVEVLCIISASLELYLALTYQSSTGKCSGEATLTISVSLFMFSASVSIHCQRQFAGSNGDPPFASLMGPDGQPLQENPHYPWRDYVEAFA